MNKMLGKILKSSLVGCDVKWHIRSELSEKFSKTPAFRTQSV